MMPLACAASRTLTNAIGERCSFDEFEDQRDDVFAFLERVDGGDVGMVQCRKDLRLAFEASDPGGVGRHRRRKHFDGDVSTELDIARSVHFTHAAGADACGDFVFAEPSSNERRVGRWLKASRAGIERGVLEKVVGRGFFEQRLDFALERLVSGARIVEKRGPALRRQRQRFVKQSFDVQPVPWIHRTPRPDGSVPGSPRGAATRLNFDARILPFRASQARGHGTTGIRWRPLE